MNRRTVIKHATLVAMLGLVDRKSLFAMSQANIEVHGYHRFQLGQLEITLVTDGHILMKPVQPNFAPGISPAMVEKALNSNFASRTEVDLGINIMIIKSEGRTIMLDSGCGSNFGKDSGWLLENLGRAGFKSADITDIVITHAHPDHIGGLTNQDGQVVFTQADIYMSKIEHDFWMSPAPDFSKSKITDEGLKKLVVNVAQNNIKATAPRLRLVEDGQEFFSCIKIHLAPGHTPGHCVIAVFSGQEKLYHLADLIHSSILVAQHPEWGFEGDTDFDLAVKTRVTVLKELTEARSLLFAYHLPWPGIGHVRKKGTGFEWIQQSSALPD